MMVFNVLLNRYKLFWPRPSLFGASRREKHAGACHRHCVGTKEKQCVIEGLRLEATFVFSYLFLFLGENNTMRDSSRNNGGGRLASSPQSQQEQRASDKLISVSLGVFLMRKCNMQNARVKTAMKRCNSNDLLNGFLHCSILFLDYIVKVAYFTA